MFQVPRSSIVLAMINVFILVGNDLVYSALIGKPSEITYVHGEQILQSEAARIGLRDPVKTVYCVGDNVCTDIFGANLYNR